MGASVAMYFTPINHEAGEKYAGRDFKKAVRANQAVISRYLSDVGVKDAGRRPPAAAVLADYAFRFSSEAFFTPHNATEHLRLPAREKVVKDVVDMIAAWKW
jgi:hypothetical protein